MFCMKSRNSCIAFDLQGMETKAEARVWGVSVPDRVCARERLHVKSRGNYAQNFIENINENVSPIQCFCAAASLAVFRQAKP